MLTVLSESLRGVGSHCVIEFGRTWWCGKFDAVRPLCRLLNGVVSVKFVRDSAFDSVVDSFCFVFVLFFVREFCELQNVSCLGSQSVYSCEWVRRTHPCQCGGLDENNIALCEWVGRRQHSFVWVGWAKKAQLGLSVLGEDNTALCEWVGQRQHIFVWMGWTQTRQLCVSGLGEHNSYVRVGWTNITELCVSGLDAHLSVSDGVGRTH